MTGAHCGHLDASSDPRTHTHARAAYLLGVRGDQAVAIVGPPLLGALALGGQVGQLRLLLGLDARALGGELGARALDVDRQALLLALRVEPRLLQSERVRGLAGG